MPFNREAMTALMRKMILFGVPEHDHESLAGYIQHGVPTGDFLRCFLDNDLQGALARADAENRHAFFQIGNFLWNEAPGACWGAEGRFDAWVKRGGLEPLPAASEEAAS